MSLSYLPLTVPLRSPISPALLYALLLLFARTLFCNFSRSGADLASAFCALNMAVATWVSTNVRECSFYSIQWRAYMPASLLLFRHLELTRLSFWLLLLPSPPLLCHPFPFIATPFCHALFPLSFLCFFISLSLLCSLLPLSLLYSFLNSSLCHSYVPSIQLWFGTELGRCQVQEYKQDREL